MLEPSIRVPMLLRWPDRIRAGQVNDEDMVLNIDVAPTLLDLAGLTPQDWMQGRSWEPLLDGKDVDWREAFLYEWFEYPAVPAPRNPRGVRTGRWKPFPFGRLPAELASYAHDRTWQAQGKS